MPHHNFLHGHEKGNVAGSDSGPTLLWDGRGGLRSGSLESGAGSQVWWGLEMGRM